jgi:hypothetical protein
MQQIAARVQISLSKKVVMTRIGAISDNSKDRGMTATLNIPAALADQPGIMVPSDLPRAALEALTLEALRQKRIGEAEAGRILGIDDRYALDSFFKRHGIEIDYTWEDLERERAAFRQAGIDH